MSIPNQSQHKMEKSSFKQRFKNKLNKYLYYPFFFIKKIIKSKSEIQSRQVQQTFLIRKVINNNNQSKQTANLLIITELIFDISCHLSRRNRTLNFSLMFAAR